MLFESDWKSGWSLNFSMHVHVMLIVFLLDSCFMQVIYIYICMHVCVRDENATTGIKTHIQIQPVLRVGCAD